MYHPPLGVCKLSKYGTAFVLKLSISCFLCKGYNFLNNNKAWIADVLNIFLLNYNVGPSCKNYYFKYMRNYIKYLIWPPVRIISNDSDGISKSSRLNNKAFWNFNSAYYIFISIFHSPEFRKLMIGGKTPNTCKTIIFYRV